MKKIIVVIWLLVHFLLVLFKDMKKFISKNIEVIMVIVWFLAIFVISNLVV
jgi:hypothetical protein